MRNVRVRDITADGKPKFTEKVFQEQIRKAAIITGWKFYHTFNSFRSTEGFPDCVMIKIGRIIFAELKSETGKVSDAQQEWLDGLKATGVEVYLWRPSDMDAAWEILNR